MMRYLSAVAVFCSGLCANVVAQNKPAPTETVIRLTVDAAGPPTPALRYQLLPEFRELNSGNAVPGFYKCLMEQNNLYYHKQAVDERERYLVCPIEELKGKGLATYGGSSSKNADYAARLDGVDWQLLPQLKTEGIGLLLPDIQVLRAVAAVLKVRFRGQIAEGDFDAGIASAKTMFAFSRALSQHPTLIGNLVGIAIAFIAIGPIEELIGQPGAPNLYWALTYLPSPLLDYRTSWQGERVWLYAEFPGLFDDDSPKSDDVLARHVARLKYVASVSFGASSDAKPFDGEKDVDVWVKKRTSDAGYMRDARKRLIAMGRKAEAVNRMSNVQVLLVDQFVRFQIAQDEMFKWLSLPHWQASAGMRAVNIGDAGAFAMFLPSALKVKEAQTRLEQRLALVRHVEAVRLHAAAHGGKLPESLSQIGVPLPIDPVNGKPFAYSVKDGVAHLHGALPAGMEKNAGWNVRYEISIRK